MKANELNLLPLILPSASGHTFKILLAPPAVLQLIPTVRVIKEAGVISKAEFMVLKHLELQGEWFVKAFDGVSP